jgi:hypothetical protein
VNDHTGGLGRGDEDQVDGQRKIHTGGHMDQAAIAEERRVEGGEGILLDASVAGEMPLEELAPVAEGFRQAGREHAFG